MKMVILLDSSGNNPVVAKRTGKKGYWYYRFPIYDKDGNDINPITTDDNLENPTKKDKKSSKCAEK